MMTSIFLNKKKRPTGWSLFKLRLSEVVILILAIRKVLDVVSGAFQV